MTGNSMTSQLAATDDICTQRRRLLQIGLGASASLAMPSAFANILREPERRISLHNLHTGEKLKTTYWAEGMYQPDEMRAINYLLRDHRTGDIEQIDSALIDLLNILHYRLDGKQPFHVISGYRSPKTNNMLRTSSSGVAKQSLHTLGKAIDIRLPGTRLTVLRDTALALKAGGVGYYPKSDFVHVDTGRVRSWSG